MALALPRATLVTVWWSTSPARRGRKCPRHQCRSRSAPKRLAARLVDASRSLQRRRQKEPMKRAAAKAEAKKETALKPLTSARDAAVNALAEFVAANIGNLPDLVQIISGYAA